MPFAGDFVDPALLHRLERVQECLGFFLGQRDVGLAGIGRHLDAEVVAAAPDIATCAHQSRPEASLNAFLMSSGRPSQRALFIETWKVVVPNRVWSWPSMK
jgi:hypothetical protein